MLKLRWILLLLAIGMATVDVNFARRTA